jgi:hypothetical protein
VHKESLKDSKNFCMAPWVTLHAWPSGDTWPCCVIIPDGKFKSGKGMTNLNETGIEDAWNAPLMKELRRNMLNDIPSGACRRCIDEEKAGNPWTLRKHLNNQFFEKHFEKVYNTDNDGSHNNPDILYWDIRFNNLCNMKCRTCSVEFSSQWYEDSVKSFNYDGPAYKGLPKEFWDNALPYLKNVEYVYFAGGEPLITEEHYTMLDTWISSGNTDLQIDYTTNFSKMNLGNKHVFDYWNKFSNVNVGASLDASYSRGEYLRKGTKWKDIVNNRRQMIVECPDTRFFLSSTISIFNALHFPDFHKEWLEEGLVSPHDININFLTEPNWLSIQNLPIDYKKKIEKRWREHIDYLEQNYFKNINSSIYDNEDMLNTWVSVINYMLSYDQSDDKMIKTFVHNTQWLDNFRSEYWLDSFPELTVLKKHEY